jgi:hypothetical protein
VCMTPLLFIDTTCPKPYSLETLRTEALGGTEGTCVRIAEELDAFVEQHCRVASEGRYLVPGTIWDNNATHVVCLRNPHALTEARKRFPKAKLFLYLHDLVGPEMGRALPVIEAARVEAVICVSKFHRMQGCRGLEGVWVYGAIPYPVHLQSRG